MFDNLPSVLDIDKLMLPSTYYGKNPDTGEYVEMAKFYDQNRSPVDFDEVAPVMYDAILSSEDPRYYQHGGVDLIGTDARSAQQRRRRRDPGWVLDQPAVRQERAHPALRAGCRGEYETDEDGVVLDENGQKVVAVTQEVLQNCWTDATTASGADGYQRKLQEMRYAIALEQKYSKNDILLGYLNIANFGGTTYGIDAAAQLLLQRRRQGPHARAGRDPRRHRAEPEHVPHRQAERIDLRQDGVGYNKAPDGLIDDVSEGQLAALDTRSPAARSRRSSTSPPPTATARPRGASSTCSAACSRTARSRRSSTTPRSSSRSRPSITAGDHRLRRGRRLRVLLPVRARHRRERSRLRRDPRGAREGAQARRPEHLHDHRLPRPGGGRATMTANVPDLGRLHEARIHDRQHRGDHRPHPRDRAEHEVRANPRPRRSDPNKNSLVFAGDSHLRFVRRLRSRIDVQALHAHRLAREGPLAQRDRQRQGPQDHQDQGQLHSRRVLDRPRREAHQELRRRRRPRRARRCSSPRRR